MNREEQIAEYRKKIRTLEKDLAGERRERLKALHTGLGFKDRAELIEALQSLRESQRSRISAATRAQIEQDLKARMPGSKVAAKNGVSVPTVQAIKKTLGLVKARQSKH